LIATEMPTALQQNFSFFFLNLCKGTTAALRLCYRNVTKLLRWAVCLAVFTTGTGIKKEAYHSLFS
jgi:hypothetical protein